MCSRVFLFVIGTVYICYQVLAVENVYIAELMVESNVTLEAQTVLSVLHDITAITVPSNTNEDQSVALQHSELVAECLIVGDATTCNCSRGYTWSNEVCYNYNCCGETTCTGNVSHIIPLCIAKVEIYINGSVQMKQTWTSANADKLKAQLQKINSLTDLNITGLRSSDNIADFVAKVSVKFDTSKLQAIVSALESDLGAIVWVDTLGMVTMESPQTSVCYKSSPVLKCMFEEATDSAGWNMTTKTERFGLNIGSVVKLSQSCATPEYKSCAAVTLQEVTGIWAGTYECGFTKGSVRHTAKSTLSVALLPDEITLMINPLTADCSEKLSKDVEIAIRAIISKSTENFTVSWSYMGKPSKNGLGPNPDGDNLVYNFNGLVSCMETEKAQTFSVTFKNSRNQEKSAEVDVPVIYEGRKFCKEEELNHVLWPKTPAGNTVINQTCAEGRVGYKSRTCEGTTWQDVFSYCISQELNKVSNAAENFLKGLGATQEVALNIFKGLKNSSTSNSAPSDSIADISVSVHILNVMSMASENLPLQENVLPDFVGSASNMLNSTWNGVNTSVVHSMSSNYLQSVEGLVKNIKINNSEGIDSENLKLKFCSSNDCNVSVFDIGVNLNKTNGIMKTVGVKNLMEKLRNNFHKTERTSLLLSATLENYNSSSVKILLDFPMDQLNPITPFCVFWNTTLKDWSDAGCKVKTSDGNRTFCECNHLTSFSVLMAKSDISTDVLDMITNVGLGVSICSLLIFLIIESLVWSAVVKTNLSHFRHTALVNIAVFLLLANCSFLASSEPDSLGDTLCLVLTACKHLFYLVMFSWMLCMSVMLVHQLIFVFSPLRKRVFMFLSSIVGYVCPILIVGSSYVYSKYTGKKYHNPKTCWLVFEKLLEGSMHAFLLPVGTVILTNLFSMVVVIVTLVKSSAPEGSKTDDKETAKSILKVVVFLTPVFGVTWVIGFAQLILETNSPLFTIASYSFTILNSFQGFFILLTGVLAEQKVREELLKLIMAKSKGKSESMNNLTSTTYTKDK